MTKPTRSRVLNKQVTGVSDSPYSYYLPTVNGKVRLYSQDQVLMSKGGSSPRALELYLDLLSDGVVSWALSKQLNDICSRKLIVEKVGDRPIDKEAADFVRSQLEHLQETKLEDEIELEAFSLNSESSFDGLTKWHLLSNVLNFTTSEVVWRRTGSGLIGVDRIIPVDPRRFVFEEDATSKAVYPRLLTKVDSIRGEALPNRKFIFHRSWNISHFDPLGSGLGPVLYWLVLWRRDALSFWLSILGRHADPPFIGEVPGSANQAQIDKFEQDLALFGRDTNMVLPPGFKVSSPAANANSAGLLKELIDWASEEASLVLTGEATIGKPGGGSEARETINNSMRVAMAHSWSIAFERTLRSTLIRWLVRYNFPGAGIPKVYRQFRDPDDILRIAKEYKALGLKADPLFVEDACGVPVLHKPDKAEAKPVPDSLLS